jgi:hypothetical protein
MKKRRRLLLGTNKYIQLDLFLDYVVKRKAIPEISGTLPQVKTAYAGDLRQ